MTALVDTPILIDFLRGHVDAGKLLERERSADVLHASEITRLEILAGVRPAEEDGTRTRSTEVPVTAGQKTLSKSVARTWPRIAPVVGWASMITRCGHGHKSGGSIPRLNN